MYTRKSNENIYNSDLVNQAFTFISNDSSHLFFGNSLFIFDDFGYTNNSAISECINKNQNYSSFCYFNILKFHNMLSTVKVNLFNIKHTNTVFGFNS